MKQFRAQKKKFLPIFSIAGNYIRTFSFRIHVFIKQTFLKLNKGKEDYERLIQNQYILTSFESKFNIIIELEVDQSANNE